MNEGKLPEICERTVRYSLRVMKLCRALEKDSVGRVLGKQLLRAGTSIGANVHEAQSAQSKPEFVAKVYIAYKEAREAAYWLRLVREGGLVSPKRISELFDETTQLIKILSAILLTAKQRLKR